MKIFPLIGTVQGLSASVQNHFVDGFDGSVLSTNRNGEGVLIATPTGVGSRNPTNSALITSAAYDPLCPIGVGRNVKVSYPSQSCSPNDTYKGDTPGTLALAGQLRPAGGTQFFCTLPNSSERVSAKYAVYFPPGFDFRLGGKLPGVSTANITANGGNTVGVGTDSVTCRHMWRSGGRLETYFYTPENVSRWGTNYGASLGTPVFFKEGWNLIETEVWMNSLGTRNGGCIGKLNGVEFVNRSDLLFRLNDSLKFDGVWFSTFFGGNTGGVGSGDNTYETLVDTFINFSDIYFSSVF